jgi:FixJ family two-component response regulator
MTDPMPSVFVVDDDPSVRRAVGRLLKTAQLNPLTFASAEEFLGQPLPEGPACLVLDVSMPGLDGLELQRALATCHASLPIIFITGHGDIRMTVQAMKGGAVDFLAKPFDNQELLIAIRQAIARGAQSRKDAVETAALRRRAGALSPREAEVMALVVSGMLNKQAARQLGVSEKTIKAHRAKVMQKMQARSLAELVRMAGRLAIAPAKP